MNAEVTTNSVTANDVTANDVTANTIDATVVTNRAIGRNTTLGGRIWHGIHNRKWPIAMTVAVITTGMAFSLLFDPLVNNDVWHFSKQFLLKNPHIAYRLHHGLIPHQWAWATPGDIWGTLESSRMIGWGSLGSIYTAHGGFLLPPGLLIMLLPVDFAVRIFHLSVSFPFSVPRPTAWLVLGPYEMAMSGFALFGLDALAEHLGIPQRRRAWLCVAEALALWQVVVIWGHPEDVVALGFGAYAIRALLNKRRVAAGWLLGAALATQTFTVLLIPVILAADISRTSLARNTAANTASRGTAGVTVPSTMTAPTPSAVTSPGVSSMPHTIWAYTKQVLPILWRAIAVPAVLVATPLIAQPKATWRALVIQPTYPKVDQPTPWLALAPKLAHGAVSGGVPRILTLLAACLIGILAYRMALRRDIQSTVILACAFSLFSWPFFESVMVSYYLWPALAFALLAAGMSGSWRIAGTLIVGMFSMLYAFFQPRGQFGMEWQYWIVVIGSLGIALIFTIPRWILWWILWWVLPRWGGDREGGRYGERRKKEEGSI